MRRLDPLEDSQILAHSADPRCLLALAREAFGHAPEAWLLTVEAEDLGFSEHLSRPARRGLRTATESVQALYRGLLHTPTATGAAYLAEPETHVRA